MLFVHGASSWSCVCNCSPLNREMRLLFSMVSYSPNWFAGAPDFITRHERVQQVRFLAPDPAL